MPEKLSLDKDLLYKYYIINKLSTTQIGKIIGCSRNSVYKYLVRYNIPLRDHSECQMGELNHKWKGDKVSNRSLHEWIRKHKPKQDYCTICNEMGHKMDVANIDHKYRRNIDDYMWVCRSCHQVYDIMKRFR